jgi:hypothetical protein
MTSEQNSLTIEQSYNERRERQRLAGLWWAVALIWTGLVLGADSTGLVPQVGDASVWNWIFLGAGVVSILGAVYRLITTNVPNPIIWDWVWGSVCLIIGLDGFVALNIFWPIVLIAIGGVILVGELWWRR